MKAKQSGAQDGKGKGNLAGIVVRMFLVVLSCGQAYWVPITAAAGTVAAAGMFGDKTYWRAKGEQVEKMVTGKKPQEAVEFIEAELAKGAAEQQNAGLKHSYVMYVPSYDLYFQLARAKEAAGHDKKEVTEAYKQALVSMQHGADALAWLCQNTPETKHRAAFEKALETLAKGRRGFQDLIRSFHRCDDWTAFKYFLDTVFDTAAAPFTVAKFVQGCLGSSSLWRVKYSEYCQGRSDLLEFLAYDGARRRAEEFVKKEDYRQAAAAYRELLQCCGSETERIDVQFNLCQYLYQSGDYRAALGELDRFLQRSKVKNIHVAQQAYWLRAQCYVQLGQLDKANEQLLAFMMEYPDAGETGKVAFYVGYCYMLQGKYEQAKTALDLVIKDYSRSGYAERAGLCLARIESMTQ